jgi:hypothetical protein
MGPLPPDNGSDSVKPRHVSNPSKGTGAGLFEVRMEGDVHQVLFRTDNGRFQCSLTQFEMELAFGTPLQDAGLAELGA